MGFQPLALLAVGTWANMISQEKPASDETIIKSRKFLKKESWSPWSYISSQALSTNLKEPPYEVLTSLEIANRYMYNVAYSSHLKNVQAFWFSSAFFIFT